MEVKVFVLVWHTANHRSGLNEMGVNPKLAVERVSCSVHHCRIWSRMGPIQWATVDELAVGLTLFLGPL